ncbi:hypothetical protein ACQP1W_49860 [Spirillospora sp. CA-255316]
MINNPPDGTELDEFVQDLIELREACGSPSLRDLASFSRKVQARHANDLAGLQELSATAISDVLARRRKRPPAWSWVASYVLACQCYARGSGAWPVDPGLDSLPGWHERYRSVRVALLPPTVDAALDLASHAVDLAAQALDLDEHALDAGGQALGLDEALINASMAALIESLTAELDSDSAEQDIAAVSESLSPPEWPDGETGGEWPEAEIGDDSSRSKVTGWPAGDAPHVQGDHHVPGPRHPADPDQPPPPSIGHEPRERDRGPRPATDHLAHLAALPHLLDEWMVSLPGGGLGSMTERRYRALFGGHGLDLLRAAEAGDMDAACRLGLLLLCERRAEEGIAWLESAAAAGDVVAEVLVHAEPAWRTELAAQLAYELTLPGYGDAWRRDDGRPTGAETYYRSASRTGHPGATYRLGLMFRARGDEVTALHLFTRAGRLAEAAQTRAQPRMDN